MNPQANSRTVARTFVFLWLAIIFNTTATAVAPQTAPPQSVRFQLRPSHVGDRLTQDVQFGLTMQTTTIRDGKQIGTESSEFSRHQRRVVTARQLRSGCVVKADVSFLKSDVTLKEGRQPVQQIVQPVAGKSYIVSREGGPPAGGALTVTDASGKIPPIEEFEIVLQSMDSIGRPNPLAEFLAGREFSVGQTISLPKEVASSFLGVAEQPSEIIRFDLTLRHVQVVADHPAAVFDVRIDARSPSQVQMGLLIEGQIIVETETCRTLVANLAGPIGMSESQSTIGTNTTVTGRGKISIAISSQYARQ